MPGRFERIMRDIDRGMTDAQLVKKYRELDAWDAENYRKVHAGRISPGHDLAEEGIL